MHSQSPASSKGVTADIGLFIANVGTEESNAFGCLLDCLVDSVLGDLAGPVGPGVVGVDAGVCTAAVGEDVMDLTGKGFDWAVVVASAFLVDCLSPGAILLVVNSEGGLMCLEEPG